jgi:hypothetical protein
MSDHTFKRYDIKEDDKKKLENNFIYHQIKTEELQEHRYQEIRRNAKEFAELLYQFCPPSRELSLAITKLEESVFWANASIARNE